MADDSDIFFKKKGAKSPKHQAHLTQATDVLQGLLQNSKSPLSDGFLRWRLEQQWPEIVGPTISQNTVPCAWERGVLFIWVSHPAWIQQLTPMQEAIREKVNAHLGKEYAKGVKFTLNRRAATTTPGSSRD